MMMIIIIMFERSDRVKTISISETVLIPQYLYLALDLYISLFAFLTVAPDFLLQKWQGKQFHCRHRFFIFISCANETY